MVPPNVPARTPVEQASSLLAASWCFHPQTHPQDRRGLKKTGLRCTLLDVVEQASSLLAPMPRVHPRRHTLVCRGRKKLGRRRWNEFATLYVARLRPSHGDTRLLRVVVRRDRLFRRVLRRRRGRGRAGQLAVLEDRILFGRVDIHPLLASLFRHRFTPD